VGLVELAVVVPVSRLALVLQERLTLVAAVAVA
jgi:hypothetical protein